MNANPDPLVLVKTQFSQALSSQITQRRVIVAGVSALALIAVAPLAVLAVKASLGLLLAGALSVVGYFAWRRFPVWNQKHENSIAEAKQVEANRHLKALKAEARSNPMEELQRYLSQKQKQLNSFRAFVTNVGGQVKTAQDFLNERKEQRPNQDFSKKQQAIDAMAGAHQKYLANVAAGERALDLLKEKISDARFDFEFGKAVQGAAQNMRELAGANVLEEILAQESFASVRETFNQAFAAIEMDAATINSANILEFGDGMTVDVSSIQIPVISQAAYANK